MAESKRGNVFRLINRLRGKADKKKETEEIQKEVQDTISIIDEINEVAINLAQTTKTDSSKQIHVCDICMKKSVFTVSSYLCYLCGEYLCEKCSEMHDKSHALVQRKHEENVRSENAYDLVLGMREENSLERGADLYDKSVEVIGQVNVKNGLDKYNCSITGLSGLDNKSWVAVDRANDCIKIFCSVSNTLLRYIHFRSEPRDVTEIKVQQKSTDPDSASGSKTDISRAGRDKPDKHCLLAVTLPNIKQIWFIDVNKTPAVKTKTITNEKECHSIDFSENNIFTLCRELVWSTRKIPESEYRYSIYIFSTEGDQLKVIQAPRLSTPYIYDLAVYKERIYLPERCYDKVFCINVEDGITIFQLKLELLTRPAGISVDPSSGVVYLCGRYSHKVYRLSPDLNEYEHLSLDTVTSNRPRKLCFMNNKLYFSHAWSSSLGNVVTVVHVLT